MVTSSLRQQRVLLLLLPPSYVCTQVPLGRAGHLSCVASEQQTDSLANGCGSAPLIRMRGGMVDAWGHGRWGVGGRWIRGATVSR